MDLVNHLKSGGVAVIPTDTLYGLVGQALNRKTVEQIYRLKKRQPQKPFIILIGNIKQIEAFKLKLTPETYSLLSRYWPGPVSAILECTDDQFAYLHRGLKSLAFRLPDKRVLREIINQTGPLVAPSANPEGYPPAKNLAEAKNFFGDAVAYKSGRVKGSASKIIRINGKKVEVVRE